MTDRPRSKLLLADEKPLQGRARRRRDPAQPGLPLDPMPDRVEPCLALSKPKAPVGDRWLYEIKFDGYRLAIHIEPHRVRILTRGGHDWTHRFPGIAAAARELGVATAILDGEAVVLDDEGRPDFGALQRSLGGRAGKEPSAECLFFAFDLLYFDGHDIRSVELTSRRHLLGDLLQNHDGAIRFSEEIEGEGAAVFRAACEHGLEGIIAKDRESSYTSGRLGDWIKIKCIQSDAFFIVGYEKSLVARAGIGSLLLAARKGNDLVYVGNVGTGFKERDAGPLRMTLDKLQTKEAPVEFEGQRRNIVWSQPILIAEIEYRSWTHDAKLRHAAYKGLRESQDNADVYELQE
jgi:bifunctional non-homologous end joining protein LigD